MRFAAILLGMMALSAHSLTYNYSDTSSWPSACSANVAQSPVNITDAQYTALSVLVTEWPSSGANATASNDEQTIMITMSSPSNTYLRNVPTFDEQTTFYLQEITFHWGTTNDTGSPHAVDGVHYPLEIHFVYYNSKDTSYSAASDDSQGLLTYAVLYNVSSTGGDTLTTILSSLNSSTFFDGSSVSLDTINYTALLPDTYQKYFYYYEGSKDYPDCTENVIWIIAKDTMVVSADQLATLRSFNISSGGPSLAPNYRSLQKIGDRKIYKSFTETEEEAGPTGNSYILALFFIFTALICLGVAVGTAASRSKQYHVIDETH